MSGARSYHAGRVAEESVAQLYAGSGRPIIARRWRGSSGEIDLVARSGAQVIFIEVKQSATHVRAAEHLSPRQMLRIATSAAEFLAKEPGGQDTEARIDVALVDGAGRIKILENAFTA